MPFPRFLSFVVFVRCVLVCRDGKHTATENDARTSESLSLRHRGNDTVVGARHALWGSIGKATNNNLSYDVGTRHFDGHR